MIKKLLLDIVALMVIGVGTFAYVAATYVGTPKFTVKNQSGVSVEVTAYWREQSRNLGTLSPGEERVFEVNDEAAMQFQAVYPGGQVITSSPAVYFTSGTTVLAVVTESSIEVSAEL